MRGLNIKWGIKKILWMMYVGHRGGLVGVGVVLLLTCVVFWVTVVVVVVVVAAVQVMDLLGDDAIEGEDEDEEGL